MPTCQARPGYELIEGDQLIEGDRRITSHGNWSSSVDLVKSARKRMHGDSRRASAPAGVAVQPQRDARTCVQPGRGAFTLTPLRSGLALRPRASAYGSS